MPVDLKNRPEEDTGDSGIHPDFYKPDTDSLEDAYNAPSATDEDLPEGHPSRSSTSSTASGSGSSATPEQLQAQESAAGSQDATAADIEESKEATGDINGGWKTNVRSARQNAKTLRNLGIAGGFIGVIVAIVFAVISLLLPFKLTSIIESIEQRVGQVPEYAVERRLEFYVSRYLMIRALEDTGRFDFNGKDKDKFTYLGKGFTDTMYTNWKGAKLEQKLLTDYNIRLVADVNPEMFNSNYKLRANHFRLENLGVSSESNLRNQPLNRSEARQFIREFARSETKSRQVLKRFHTRRVMKNYFGVGNWRPFEAKRDELSNRYFEKKRAFQTRMINETVGRLSERSALYIDCLISGKTSLQCRETLKRADPNTSRPSGSEGEDGTEAAEDEIENDDNSNDRSRLSRKINSMIQDFGLKKLLTTLATGIGIIESLNQLYKTADSGVINQVIYDKNAQQYVAYSAPILSAADQIRAGDYNFNSEDAKVVNEIFDGFEESLVYQAGVDRGSSTVSAQGGKSADCNNDPNDGKETVLKPGETVCPDKKLLQNKTGFTDHPAWVLLGNILKPYQDTVGNIISGATNLIGSITDALGVDSVISGLTSFFKIDEAAAKLFGALLNQIAGPVISGAEIAGPAYDNLYAGITVLKSSLGGEVGVSKEDTIGGGYLSMMQVQAIQNAQMEDYYFALNSKPTLERYFSPLVKESITGQVAMGMPSSVSSSAQSFVNGIASGFNILGNVTAFFTRNAGAQTFPEDNPFDVIHMGFAQDHAVFSANDGEGLNPDELNQQYKCDLPVSERPQNKEFGKPDGLPFEVPTMADPCLLEEAVLGAGTMYFTGTFDEGFTSNTAQASSSNTQPLAGNTASTPCAAGTTDAGETDGYANGVKYLIRLCEIPNFSSSSSEDPNGLVRVNSTASGQWQQLVQLATSQGVNLKAINSFRTMARQEYFYNCYITKSCNNGNEAAKPGFSNHQIGFAVDIDIIVGKDPSLTSCKANPAAYPIYDWLAKNAPPLGLKAGVDSECWHWSVSGN